MYEPNYLTPLKENERPPCLIETTLTNEEARAISLAFQNENKPKITAKLLPNKPVR